MSGGFILARPHLPIPQVAALVQGAEKRAKEAGRDRLTVFGQPVPWRDLPALTSWAARLEAHMEAGQLSSALVYRWLELYREFRAQEDEALALRYKPLLLYSMREKSKEIRGAYEDLFNHTHAAWRFLPVWVEWALYARRNIKEVA